MKANKEMEIGYMDGYDVGYDSALEFSESNNGSIIEQNKTQLA